MFKAFTELKKVILTLDALDYQSSLRKNRMYVRQVLNNLKVEKIRWDKI